MVPTDWKISISWWLQLPYLIRLWRHGTSSDLAYVVSYCPYIWYSFGNKHSPGSVPTMHYRVRTTNLNFTVYTPTLELVFAAESTKADLTVSQWGLSPAETCRHAHSKACSRIFTAAQFVITKTWKWAKLSTKERAVGRLRKCNPVYLILQVYLTARTDLTDALLSHES